MFELIFNYNQVEKIIQTNLNDSFKEIIQKYINRSQLDIINIYFISNDQKISRDGSIINIMNEYKKINKRKMILVLSINNAINNIINTIKSKDIMCPA